MNAMVALVKWLGWRGLLALVFLGAGLWMMADRDAQARRAAQAEAMLSQRDETIRAKNEALRAAARALGTAAANIRIAARANSGWQDTVGTVTGLLDACQAENTRVSEDARKARALAERIEAQAERQIGDSLKRWNARSPQCDAALKSMEAACEGL